jgi:hypothetical protein
LSLSIGAAAGLSTGNFPIGSNFVCGGTICLHFGISNNFASTFIRAPTLNFKFSAKRV